MSLERQKVLSGAPVYRKSDDVAVLFARAAAYHQHGQLADAQAGYKKVLKSARTISMLGVCELGRCNYEAAVRPLKRALLLDHQSAVVHSDLGIALKALQRHHDALVSFDSAIALKPDFANAHYNRGNLLNGLNRFGEAVTGFDRAIAINPRHVHAWKSRGDALHQLGRFVDAIASYDQALAIAPNDAGAWANRAELLRRMGRLDEALASSDKALSINPEIAEAWLVRSIILLTKGKVTDSQAYCQRALAIKPDYAKAFTQLGQCHLEQSNAEAAVPCFDRALVIKPDDEITMSARIFALDFSADAGFAGQQAARSEWWRRIGSKISTERPAHYTNDRDPNRRIVLGYVSAEFRQHSAALAFRPVLENHDKTRFEVICYSGSPGEDTVTDAFRQVADRWRNACHWSDDQLADCIRADKVDILIDLSGHTERNRLRTFARKPAPIQVTAWGHATGTGLPTIDYLFSDPVSIPEDVRDLFAEQIHDLPCAIIIEPPGAKLRCSEPAVTSNGYLTYGVFNRVSKFSHAAIGLWARILQSDLTSRLLIKDRTIDDAGIRRMLLERFAFHGIAPDRVRLLGSTSREEHLASYRQVDVCLDPFPHGGGVSTWEALHMGVPVVAKLGNGMAERVAGAILSAIGMPDWVAADDDRYVEIALRPTPEPLREIRHELPDLIGRSCSPAAYTSAVEDAYGTMWRKYCGAVHSQIVTASNAMSEV